jgi:hypothetical protein
VSNESSAPRYLGGLEEADFVVLHDRRLPSGRGRVDHLVVGPTGVYVVQTRPWTGQISVEGDRLFVDGRAREGVIEDVHRLALGAQGALGGDLKPHGVAVTAVVCFPNIELPLFRQVVRGVTITGGRGLSRAIREAEAVLSVKAVDELAIVAHETFEPADKAR